jgi:ADP-heptose:LPS heptosyltransferase
MKFLIISFHSIGDIVLTTPVVRCLKQQIVTAEVHYLTKSAFRPILAANPYIDKAHYLQDDLQEPIAALKEEDFDYVIDLHHNWRGLRVKRALGKKAFSFHTPNRKKSSLVYFKWNRKADKHIVDRYFDTIRSFGVSNDGAGLDFRKLKELCTAIEHPVILLGGPEDADSAGQLAAIDPIKIYNACGKFNLNESADLVRRSKLVVTPDTGLMHIAVAFKRPVISIWGNTVPEFGMYPYYGDNYLTNYGRLQTTVKSQTTTGFAGLPYEIVEVRELSCRPCSRIGYKKCPRGHFKCMGGIRTDDVLEKIYMRLKR